MPYPADPRRLAISDYLRGAGPALHSQGIDDLAATGGPEPQEMSRAVAAEVAAAALAEQQEQAAQAAQAARQAELDGLLFDLGPQIAATHARYRAGRERGTLDRVGDWLSSAPGAFVHGLAGAGARLHQVGGIATDAMGATDGSAADWSGRAAEMESAAAANPVAGGVGAGVLQLAQIGATLPVQAAILPARAALATQAAARLWQAQRAAMAATAVSAPSNIAQADDEIRAGGDPLESAVAALNRTGGTALTTALVPGGSGGVESMATRIPGQITAGTQSMRQALVNAMGKPVRGAASEIPEELTDSYTGAVIEGMRPGKTVRGELTQATEQAGTTAAVSGILGGAGEAPSALGDISEFRQRRGGDARNARQAEIRDALAGIGAAAPGGAQGGPAESLSNESIKAAFTPDAAEQLIQARDEALAARAQIDDLIRSGLGQDAEALASMPAPLREAIDLRMRALAGPKGEDREDRAREMADIMAGGVGPEGMRKALEGSDKEAQARIAMDPALAELQERLKELEKRDKLTRRKIGLRRQGEMLNAIGSGDTADLETPTDPDAQPMSDQDAIDTSMPTTDTTKPGTGSGSRGRQVSPAELSPKQRDALETLRGAVIAAQDRRGKNAKDDAQLSELGDIVRKIDAQLADQEIDLGGLASDTAPELSDAMGQRSGDTGTAELPAAKTDPQGRAVPIADARAVIDRARGRSAPMAERGDTADINTDEQVQRYLGKPVASSGAVDKNPPPVGGNPTAVVPEAGIDAAPAAASVSDKSAPPVVDAPRDTKTVVDGETGVGTPQAGPAFTMEQAREAMGDPRAVQPDFTKWPDKTVQRVADIANRVQGTDIDPLVNTANNHSRAAFAKLTGIKLPTTQRDSRTVLERWMRGEIAPAAKPTAAQGATDEDGSIPMDAAPNVGTSPANVGPTSPQTATGKDSLQVGQRVRYTKGKRYWTQATVTGMVNGRPVLRHDDGKTVGENTGIEPGNLEVISDEAASVERPGNVPPVAGQPAPQSGAAAPVRPAPTDPGAGQQAPAQGAAGASGFVDDLDAWSRGVLPTGTVLNLGNAGSILQGAGIPDAPIQMTQGVLDKAINGKHAGKMSLSDIAKLPSAVNDPIMVFPSRNNPDSKTVLTEVVTKDGDHLVVAININTNRKRIQVNDVRSVHARPAQGEQSVADWFEMAGNGKIVPDYISQEKAKPWLGAAQGAYPVSRPASPSGAPITVSGGTVPNNQPQSNGQQPPSGGTASNVRQATQGAEQQQDAGATGGQRQGGDQANRPKVTPQVPTGVAGATPLGGKPARTVIGKNAQGETIEADANGVRSILTNGIREQEAMLRNPDGSWSPRLDRGRYATVEENTANRPSGAPQAPADARTLDEKLAAARARAKASVEAGDRARKAQAEQQAKAQGASEDQKAALEKMRRILRGQGPAASNGGPLFDAAWELVEASIRRGVASFRAMLEGIRADAAELASMRAFQEVMEQSWDAAHAEGLVDARTESAADVLGQPAGEQKQTNQPTPEDAGTGAPDVDTPTGGTSDGQPTEDRAADRSAGGVRAGDGEQAQGAEQERAGGSRGRRDGPVRRQLLPAGARDEARTGEQSDADPGAGGAVQGVASPARDQAPAQVSQPGTGFHFASVEDAMPPRGDVARIKANLAAVALARQIQADGRRATEDEKRTLAQFSGWGSLKWAFNPRNEDHPQKGRWVKAVREGLSGDEFSSADSEATGSAAANDAIASTLNAHFTHPQVVMEVWETVQRLMGNVPAVQGRLLANEPSVGMGVFLSLEPEALRGRVQWTGVEKERWTARIAGLVHDQHAILHMPFEQFDVRDGHYDLFIGNVPFGNFTLSERRYDHLKAPIHDHFFIKAMDKTRPGGLVAFVTSTGTMDKPDQALREEMAERGDLIHAIRYPGGAHDSAGTDVVTDVLFFRRREPGLSAGDQSWLTVGTVPDPDGGTPIPVNRWFIDRPHLVLGTINRTGTLHGTEKNGEKRPNVVKRDTFPQEVRKAIEAAPEGVMSPRADGGAVVRQQMTAPGTLKPYSLTVVNGKIFQKVGGDLVPVIIGGVKGSPQRVMWMRSVLDAMRAVWVAEANGLPSEAARAKLNTVYDAQVRNLGPLNSPANRRAFRMDPDAPNLLSLEIPTSPEQEESDEEGSAADADSAPAQATTYIKGPAFTRPTLAPPPTKGRAENATQGVAASLGQVGVVDPSLVAEAMGITAEQAAERMRAEGVAFEVPGGGWVERSVYLSGNVKAKLATAKEAAAKDERYAPNVPALESVQPADKDASEISPILGANWIPTEVLGAFVATIDSGATVTRMPTGSYAMSGGSATPDQEQAWGYKGKWRNASPSEVLSAALNGTSIDMGRETRDGYVADIDGNKGAAEKVIELKEHFRTWITNQSNAAHMAATVEAYNRIVNVNHYEPINDRWLTFPEKNPAITLDAHQVRGIARIAMNRSGFLAWEVGAGKTFGLVGAAMEMKRMGVVRKPVIATLKSLTAQMGRDAALMYPGKSILVEPATWGSGPMSREAFYARLANAEYDVAIVSHVTITSLPNDPTFEAAVIQEDVDEAMAAYAQVDGTFRHSDWQMDEKGNVKGAKGSGKGGRSPQARVVAAIARRILRAEKRISDLRQHALKVDNITFQHTGIDFLMVDEAHAFKNMVVTTTMENVKGLGSTQDTARTTDLMVKARALAQIHGSDKGLVLATGTPISNTITEMFAYQRMLQSMALQDAGLVNFDDWARAFATTKTTNEVQPDGSRKPITRFAEWVNLDGLTGMLRPTFDVVLTKQIPRVAQALPRFKETHVKVPLTAKQQAYREFVASRMAAIASRKGPPVEGDDIPLTVFRDAQMSAIDMRLVNKYATEMDGSKLPSIMDEVARNYREAPRIAVLERSPEGKATKVERSQDGAPPVQFIFQDVQSNPTLWGFNINTELVRGLVARGIPRDEIVVMDGNMPPAAVAQAKVDAALGKYKVIIGSTQVVGTGTNAQAFGYAGFHLDAPYVPAAIIQRDGRTVRQGNLYRMIGETIIAGRAITEGTMDEALWQRLDIKWGFITDFLSSIASGNSMADAAEVEVDGFDPEMTAALASGDRELIRLIEVDQERDRLHRRKMQANANAWTAAEAVKFSRSVADVAQRDADAARSEHAERAPLMPEKAKDAPREGETGADGFTKALNDIADGQPDKGMRTWAIQPQRIGSYADATYFVRAVFRDVDEETGKVTVSFRVVGARNGGEVGDHQVTGGTGLVAAIRNRINGLPGAADALDEKSATYRRRSEDAAKQQRELEAAGFPDQGRLDELEAESKQLREIIAKRPKKETSATDEDFEQFNETLRMRTTHNLAKKRASKARKKARAEKEAKERGLVRGGPLGYDASGGDTNGVNPGPAQPRGADGGRDDQSSQGASGVPGQRGSGLAHPRTHLVAGDIPAETVAYERGDTSPSDDKRLSRFLAGQSIEMRPGDSLTALVRGYVEDRVPAFSIRGQQISDNADAATAFAALRSPFVERFSVMVVSPQGTVLRSAIHHVGTINQSMSPDEGDLRDYLTGAPQGSVLYVCHNHPSGNPQPSSEDIAAYARMRAEVSSLGYRMVGIITNGERFAEVGQHLPMGFTFGTYTGAVKQGYEAVPYANRQRITSKEEAAKRLRLIQTTPGSVVVVGITGGNYIQGVEVLDHAPAANELRVLLSRMGAAGAVVSTGTDAMANEIAAKLNGTPYARDVLVVTAQGFTSLRESNRFTPSGSHQQSIDATISGSVMGGPVGFDDDAQRTSGALGRPELAANTNNPDERRALNLLDEAHLRAIGQTRASIKAADKAAQLAVAAGDPAKLAEQLISIMQGRDQKLLSHDQIRMVPALRSALYVSGEHMLMRRLRNAELAYGKARGQDLAMRRDLFRSPGERAADALIDALNTTEQDIQEEIQRLLEALAMAQRKVDTAQSDVDKKTRALDEATLGGDQAGMDLLKELERIEDEAKSIAREIEEQRSRAASENEAEEAQRQQAIADLRQREEQANAAVEAAKRMVADERTKRIRAEAKANDRQDLIDAATSELKRAQAILDQAHAERDKITAQLERAELRQKEKQEDMRKALRQRGIDIDQMIRDYRAGRPVGQDEAMKALQVMSERPGTEAFFRGMEEYWMSSILSAASTHAANMVSNTAHLLWVNTIERGAAAAMEAAFHGDTGAAKEMLKAWRELAKAGVWAHAVNSFWMTMQYRVPWFAAEQAARSTNKDDVVATIVANKGKIAGRSVMDEVTAQGKKGLRWWLTTPLGMLSAADQFMQTLIAHAEVGDIARRLAIDEKVPQEKRADMIRSLVEDRGSSAWALAHQQALQQTFNAEPGKFTQKVIDARNALDYGGFRPAAYLIPFINTPVNLFKRAWEMSPAAIPGTALQIYRMARDPEQKARTREKKHAMYRRIGTQVATSAVLALVIGAVLGDDDEDEPRITGGNTVTRRGTVYPAYSVRVGDAWYGYGRLDPFATTLGGFVDALERKRDLDAGKEGVGSDAIRAFGNLAASKSFMQGVADAIALSQGRKDMGGWASSMAASFLPNLIRSVGRSADPAMDEPRTWGTGADWWQRVGTRTLEKMQVVPGFDGTDRLDYLGRQLMRDDTEGAAGVAWRALSPVARRSLDDLHPADTAIRRFNQTNPAEAWVPGIMQPKIRMNGQDYILTDEQLQEMTAIAGRIAEPRLRRLAAIANRRPEGPMKRDIDEMRKELSKARDLARKRIMAQIRQQQAASN